MRNEPEFFPMEIKKAEKRIKHLTKKKRKHEKMLTSTDPKEEETPDELVDTKKKHAKEIKSLEGRIKWLERRKRCMVLAMENSIDLMAASNLLEQEEEAVKDKIEQEKMVEQQQQAAGAGEESSLLPLPIRCRPFPKGCDSYEYLEWAHEYKRVLEINVSAVVIPDDKRKLLPVADTIVNVSYTCYNRKQCPNLNDLNEYITGFFISWDMTNKTARILTCNCFGYTESGHKICVRWQYMEGTIFEAELLFISSHYMIAVLEIAFSEMPVNIPSEIVPSFGLCPKYKQEVFSLARDKDLSLMVRRGTIFCQSENIGDLRQGYLFVDYELPECGPGGPVVDHNGDVVGMSFSFEEKGTSVILPISAALICVDMWTKFGRIAHPLLGLCFKNVELMDEVSDDIRFDGFTVDEVHPDSSAWELGIRSGNVIISIDV